MVDIVRKGLVFREVWFDEPWTKPGADVVLFYHWGDRPGGQSREVHSREIDLRLEELVIWGGFSGSTRNQINRARREGVREEICCSPSTALLEEFFSFYEQFTAERGLGSGRPEWMSDYAACGAVVLTRALDPNETTLVWHSYFRNGDSVRQLHSVSAFATAEDKERRNLVARANRALHWGDMQEFRRLGLARFDFGGIYAGDTDEKLLKVNAFKQEFGGTRTLRFHATLPVSMKGRLFLALRDRLRSEAGSLHVV